MSSGGRQSHEFETRISAIADFPREGKRKKKALLLFPRRPACGDRLRSARGHLQGQQRVHATLAQRMK
jgi:hypothetical protein